MCEYMEPTKYIREVEKRNSENAQERYPKSVKRNRKKGERKSQYNDDYQKQEFVMKLFWQDRERVASLLNDGLFHGKKIILPAELVYIDSDVVNQSTDIKTVKYYRRQRDILCCWKKGENQVLIGIENQQLFHLAMPLRTMEYDSQVYISRYMEFKKRRKKNKGKEKLLQEERMSGMKRDEKLYACFTVVFFCGEEWNGPLTMTDMLQLTDVPEEICEIMKQQDYPLHLVRVMDDTIHYSHPEIQEVTDIARKIIRKEYDKLEGVILTKELAMTVGAITGSTDLIKIAEEKEDTVNMCKALDELKQRGKEEGIRMMIISMNREHIPIETIMKVTKYSRKDVEKLLT